MQTLDDLNRLNMKQLKGIATQLGAAPKSNISKADLVRLVYDIQQPDVEERDTSGETVIVEDAPTEAEKLEAIENFLEGTAEFNIIEDTYVVTDFTGEEIARGSVNELWALATAGVEAEDTQVEDTPAANKTTTTTGANTPDGLIEALNTLDDRGLKYEIEADCVKLSAGSSKTTTTLHQPLRSIVNVARTLCKAPM